MSGVVCQFVSGHFVLVSSVRPSGVPYGRKIKYVISDVLLAASMAVPRRLHLIARKPTHCTRRSISRDYEPKSVEDLESAIGRTHENFNQVRNGDPCHVSHSGDATQIRWRDIGSHKKVVHWWALHHALKEFKAIPLWSPIDQRLKISWTSKHSTVRP